MQSSQPQTTSPKFFGRRKGRVIRKAKSVLLDSFLPKLKITPETVFDPEALFGRKVENLCLEIGFGDGQHLFGQSLKNPQDGFIGIEVFQNGVANLLSLLTGLKDGAQIPQDINVLASHPNNIRIFDDDARLLFEKIPTGFFDKIFLLFPDPWPKKRHAQRRFVNPENLKQLARILKKGGLFKIATDHPVYKSWVLRTMHACQDFQWTAKCADDWRLPPSDWVETKYQKKALREGRKPVFFEYRRI